MRSYGIRLILLILPIVLVGGSACALDQAEQSLQEPETMATPPTITSKDALADHAVEQVRLIGRYTQIDIRKRPDTQPAYRGHVAIVLDDGTEVLLYPIWHSEARRPAEEIARFEGQRVAVIGTVYPEAPAGPGGDANLQLPCVTEVESVELAR